MRWKGLGIGVLAVLALAVGTVWSAANEGRAVADDWRTASREPTGIAPDPAVVTEPVVQVYAARAFSWRGYFGVHTWIAAKRRDDPQFTVYEVIGWRAYHGGSALSVSRRAPDRRWFGAEPQIILDLRGDEVESVIDDIERAVETYPYTHDYRVWPGPNSNTFTAYVARRVPGLALDLPPTAVGKDYLANGVLAGTPSGSGYQVSLWGLLGVLAAADEGVEINLLGLTFGVDPGDLALKLPGIGRISPAQ